MEGATRWPRPLPSCWSNATSGGSDLYAGAQTAAALPGVSVVSMSWGSAEYDGEGAFDGDFTTPAGHPGVTFVASTGDTGAPGLYPAYSPNVLAVGGTNLTLSGRRLVRRRVRLDRWRRRHEHHRGPAGLPGVRPGDRPADDPRRGARRRPPDRRLGLRLVRRFRRLRPVDEDRGHQPGGPLWAALIAIATRAASPRAGRPWTGPSQVLPALYALPAADFHDVTAGGNGVFEAGPGYDESTGLGSPSAAMVAPALAYYDLCPGGDQLGATDGRDGRGSVRDRRRGGKFRRQPGREFRRLGHDQRGERPRRRRTGRHADRDGHRAATPPSTG